MGLYTEHWARYRKQSLRGTLRALLIVGVGLPVLALAGWWLEPLDDLRMSVLGVLMVAWIVLFTVTVQRASRVVCPRCGAHYTRGKYLVNCPACGLRMLQEDP